MFGGRGDDIKRTIQSEGHRRVIHKIPDEVSNYDARLWSIAPLLLMEVLYLRTKLKEGMDAQ